MPVTVDGDVVTGVSALLDAGGVLTGRLVDPAGTGVVGCQIQARARDASLAPAPPGPTPAVPSRSAG